ncbi:helix-turn-helix domain-containing protein [Eudoraea sp.]|uniref:helix-turn-helix domain-containing protein n=1 Tax=Eudoraea sp. TaxID=1979955 RepID=UPI003C75C440
MDTDVISLVHALGIFQGLILGVILLFIHRRNKSTFFLGLFLIGFAIEFLPVMLKDFKILENHPGLLLLPISFSWILFPLFFLYVQKISIFAHERVTYRILYPGAISILLLFLLFLLPESTKEYLRGTYLFEIFFVLGISYSLYIVIRINKYVNNHTEEVKNQFATVKNKQLQWTRFFIVFCLVLVGIRIGTLFIKVAPIFELLIACANLILVFSIAISGIIQYNVFSAVQHANLPVKHSTLQKEDSKEKVLDLINRIDEYIIDSAIYSKQDLTVVDISTALSVHPRDVSMAINKHYNKNFNTYINEFRINRAQELLKTDILNNLSIEGLSREVGFHSKASFYSAFKKATGTTPMNYHTEELES